MIFFTLLCHGDNSLRKGRGFSERWGFQHFAFGNPYAYRAKNPKDLLAFTGDREGPDNLHYLAEMAMDSDLMVVAWGNALPKELRAYARKIVRDILVPSGKPIKCLGYTADHQPKHPLTLGYKTKLMEFRP